MDVFVRGEGYAEEADGDQDAAYLAHHETELGRGITVLLDIQPVASMIARFITSWPGLEMTLSKGDKELGMRYLFQ